MACLRLELIQTELHHVRTLRIMDGVFRRGMLDEVQLEPGIVHALFPCLEKLLVIHTRFLGHLLNRRQHCLQPESTHNFTISRISDLLLQQVANSVCVCVCVWGVRARMACMLSSVI